MTDLAKALETAGFTPYMGRNGLVWFRDGGMNREYVSVGKTRARVSVNVPIEQVSSILSGGVRLTEDEHKALSHLLSTIGAIRMQEHYCPCNACAKTREAITTLYVLRNRYSNRLTGGGASDA